MALSTALNFQCHKNIQDFFLKNYFRILFLGLHKSTNHNADYLLKLKFIKSIYFIFCYIIHLIKRKASWICVSISFNFTEHLAMIIIKYKVNLLLLSQLNLVCICVTF